MYLSQKWLNDFVKLPKSLSPEELGLRLTMHTVEIDSVENQSEKLKGIVVGKILEVEQHPNADRLRLAKVDVKNEVLDIVCGAPNIEVGQLVPVATVGTELPNGLVIKKSEIRGEKSCGMLCAEDEIGLGSDHDGILILDKKAKVGQSLASFLKLDDVLYEVDNKSITNRPDLWGHYGIAREISSFLGAKFNRFPSVNIESLKIDSSDVEMKVDVQNAEKCGRYMGVVLDGIEIAESPKWLQERLIAVGVRPINNVVDITNYVMFEVGQPMHAFDKDLVDEIVVRNARRGEEIKTLDGKMQKLNDDMLVIADSGKAIAIAGVMGGANSEVSEATKSIVLESANFDFVSVRKTSQKLGLRTEASMRFEKSLDPNLCELAIVRAVELIKKVCSSARVVSEVADVSNFELNQGPIKLDAKWIESYIDKNIGEEKIVEILESLDFEVDNNNGKLSVHIPSWRATKDISIKEDIAEEVARIYGYNNIKPEMPRIEMRSQVVNEERSLERRVKGILSSVCALSEVYNYSFVGEENLSKLGIDCSNYLKLVNPIASHQTLLRQSLTSGLMANVKTNQARYENIGMFEIGSVYLPIMGDNTRGDDSGNNLPFQEKKIGIVLAAGEKEEVFRDVKGVVNVLFAELGIGVKFSVLEEGPSWSDKGCAASVNVGNVMLGVVSRVDKKVRQKFGIKKQVVVAEISMRELFVIVSKQKVKKYKAFEKFPAVVRDLAFVVNEKVLYNDIKSEILNFNDMIFNVELFDEYQGEKLGEGKKSLAFHVEYQANRTMKSEEVDVVQAELFKRMEERFDAKLRSF